MLVKWISLIIYQVWLGSRIAELIILTLPFSNGFCTLYNNWNFTFLSIRIRACTICTWTNVLTDETILYLTVDLVSKLVSESCTYLNWMGGCELSYGEEEKIMRFIIFPLQLPCPCYCYNQWEWWTLFMQHNGPGYYQGVCFVPIIMFYHFYLHLLSFCILCCFISKTLCYITGEYLSHNTSHMKNP